MSEKPVRPDDSECCGSGCKPCIFDVYEDRLKKWLANKENVTESKALDQIKYSPFLITNISGQSLKVFTFQAVTLKSENTNLIRIQNAEYEILQEPLKIKSGEYLILKGVYEGETISRSYTPVLDKDSFEKGIFTIIISLQPNGKMSSFLNTLQQHDIVFWRGPFLEFQKNITSFKHILLFGGGTGIVPLYNISKSIVEDEENEIWVKVFASFKTVDSIILRKEFAKLRDFWNFQMSMYITNQSDFKANYNETIICKRLDESVIEGEMQKCLGDDVFVIICGPQGFNQFVVNALKKCGFDDENIFIFW